MLIDQQLAFTVIWQKIELFWHDRELPVYIQALNVELETKTCTYCVGTASSSNSVSLKYRFSVTVLYTSEKRGNQHIVYTWNTTEFKAR